MDLRQVFRHTLLKFLSGATSRMDCSTSQVARQSEKSLWPPTWDVERKRYGCCQTKMLGVGFPSPKFTLRHGRFFQMRLAINSQCCHGFVCGCTILRCSGTARCELLRNWRSACGKLPLFLASHETIQYTRYHTDNLCGCRKAWCHVVQVFFENLRFVYCVPKSVCKIKPGAGCWVCTAFSSAPKTRSTVIRRPNL